MQCARLDCHASNGQKGFTKSALGERSGAMPYGNRSNRYGFAVKQVSYANKSFALGACLMGPLPGPIQSTPAAEATALMYYIMIAKDHTNLFFFSECQWVVDCFFDRPHGHHGSWACTCGYLEMHLAAPRPTGCPDKGYQSNGTRY